MPLSAQPAVRRTLLILNVTCLHAYDQHAPAHAYSMLALLALNAAIQFTAACIASQEPSTRHMSAEILSPAAGYVIHA